MLPERQTSITSLSATQSGSARWRWRLRLQIVLVLVLVVGAVVPSRAEDPSVAQSEAETLFMEGRTLMEAGRMEEACKRFEASERLDRVSGTMINLARCYANLGRTATAWVTYRAAAVLAQKEENADRKRVAEKLAVALEPSLAKLSIHHTGAVPDGDDLGIFIDGKALRPNLWNVPMPVDPGAHQVEIRRGSEILWTTRVDVMPAVRVVVALPGLSSFARPARAQASVLPSASSSVLRSSLPPSREEIDSRASVAALSDTSGLGAQRAVALALGAASVLGLAYATFETVRAVKAYDDSKPNCNASNQCVGDGLAQRDLAFDRAARATWFFGGSAVALAGASVLWFTARTGADSHSSLGPLKPSVSHLFSVSGSW